MKLIYKVFLSGILCLAAISCDESNIDIQPSQETEISFFQTEDGYTKAVMGVYQKLRTMYAHQKINMMGVWLLPDDNLTTLGDHPAEVFVTLNPETGYVRELYSILYELIARSNVILYHLENDENVFESQEDRDNIEGETRFLRAYAYYFLWNFWGGAAPLVTERATNFDETTPESAGGNALINKAIEEFEMAATLLPDAWPTDMIGRATKNSANGYLVKALMYRGTVTDNDADFSEAMQAYNKISGVSLTPMYQDNFSAFDENNEESLFEVQVSDRPIATFVWGTDDNSSNGYTAGSWDFFDNGYFNWNNPRYVPTQALIDTYNEDDPRYDFTIVYDSADNETQIGKYVTDNAFIWSRPDGKSLSINNPRLLRYADVMLLNAEAIVRTGGALSDAIELVNEIRTRARNSAETPSAEPANYPTSESDAQTVLEWIFKERRIELAAEESHRWFDLRRRHMAGEIDLTSWNFSSLSPIFEFQEKNIYMPVPASEFELNPNLTQNAGY